MHLLRVVTILIAVLGMSVAASAQNRFDPVPEGYVGTPFRGLALGQTREQVEQVLNGHGLRCLTEDELPPSSDLMENTWGASACRIAWRRTLEGLDKTIATAERHNFDLALGYPFYGVLFVAGKAAVITLDPEYFDAAGMPPYEFAQGIANFYPLQDGLTSYGSGWRGYSDRGEVIIVHSYRGDKSFLLVVALNAGGQQPSFN